MIARDLDFQDGKAYINLTHSTYAAPSTILWNRNSYRSSKRDASRRSRRATRWPEGGRAFKGFRVARGLSQERLLEKWSKACGEDVYGDVRSIRLIEAGKRRPKGRDQYIALLTKVFQKEDVPTINKATGLWGWDGLSPREIGEIGLRDALHQSSLSQEKESPSSARAMPTRVIVPPYPMTPASLSSGLMAYYCFGPNANTNDLSGNKNHGTLSGNAWLVAGRMRDAVSLDGIDAHILVPHSPSLTLKTFTLAAWIFPSFFQGRRRILEKGNSNSYWLNVVADGSAVVGFYDGEHRDLRSRAPLPVCTWLFLVGTNDSEMLRLYVNGRLENSMPIRSTPLPNDEPLTIGWKYRGIELDHFAGLIDEIRIYNRALSGPEIRYLYDSYVIDYGLLLFYQAP